MKDQILQKNHRQVAYWLWIGVGMIMIQVILGGITRLTESGLSITEWKPITGALPPLNEGAWMAEFEKYRNTDQFKYVHQHFSLSDFKFIFFWEWFHRQWARLLGLVFLAGFFYFLAKRKIDRGMVKPMIILFVLGALQGLVGWIMVKSGLVPEKYYVGHVELTTHFMAALILLVYTAWFAISLMPAMQQKTRAPGLKKLLTAMAILFCMQLIYGGFMAGLRAGATAPTWPSINGALFPKNLLQHGSWILNITSNPIMVHFIHRGLAYLLVALACVYFYKASRQGQSRMFKRLNRLLLFLFLLQLCLGILTVLNAPDKQKLVWLGVSHQFTAMLLVLNFTALFWLLCVRAKPKQ